MRFLVLFGLGLGLLLLLATSLGCASIPRGAAAVDAVSLEGNRALSSSDIEEKMATAPSPKFLGLFQGIVYDYELFDRSVLQRDLERIERYYRARGYYEAKVRAGRIRYKSDDHVNVTIEVEEDGPVRIREARIDGIDGLPPEDAEAVETAMTRSVKIGQPFEEDPFRKAESSMKRALTDRGYAWAKVERRADVDLPGHHASLFFSAHPGPKAVFGAIRIEGLGELPEGPVRRALDISPRDRYSTTALDDAGQAVLNLGTFSSVEVKPDLAEPPPPSGVVPLRVHVQLQKLKSVILGGGIEMDSIRTEAHFRLGWEHKNLFGGFRHFTVELRPGLNLYPTRLPKLEPPTRGLPEERLRATLHRPGFLEARTNGVISQELNTYPWQLGSVVDKKASVLGYVEYKSSLGVDRTLWKFFGAPSYNLQYNHPFTYEGTLSPELRDLVLSYVDVLGHLDLRDDQIQPHAGLFLQNDLQIAGLGGDARDVRIQPELRGYVPITRKVTLAARATVGFLFPFNYGETDRPGSGHEARDIELMYLRGFFSGGPSSNRGYPLRSIGPHGVVPFLRPDLPARAASCALGDTSARCAMPLGGLSLWEASLELRFPLYGALHGTTFCDASDVSAHRFDLRPGYLHLSCGLGLRYDTPIGPVRLDAGYRIPGAQIPAGTPSHLEGEPGTLYGVPIAVAVGIGEAF